MTQDAPPNRRPNRLAREKSPYLLQHQFNPVDWFPWGEEAFQEARTRQAPIFLSIGYSTCHWCHVMEREAFEDEAVAAWLKEHFVAIKVDREERPDVDKIYMTAVQAIAGQGGWPLNVFLTPDLKPFYGGTYFPPQSRPGIPGFLALLKQIHQVWQNKRPEIEASALELHRRLAHLAKPEPLHELELTASELHHAAAEFKEEYDPQHGGFGHAPKFPRPSQPLFLLRYGQRFLDQDALDMVLHTCERMAAGGLHDQLGGGFARYSVDERWLVPHFEKMLYDNAQLANLYLEAFRVSGKREFAQVARGIFRYLLRDMTHPEGGFYSAEDADSEGKEGKFYLWDLAELKTILDPSEFQVVQHHYGLTGQGNFLDHSDPHPLLHQNILSVVHPQVPPADLPQLTSARQKMLAARSRRVRPHLDDKILASWNGLMLGALSRGYALLEDLACREAAAKNLAFLKARLWDAGRRTLHHRWRDGERDTTQLLDAYAFLASGVLDFYEATLEPEALEFALALVEAMIARFYDPAQGAFWQTPADASHLILRFKEDYDGAEPSGNSVAALVLLRLAAIAGRDDLREMAGQTLRFFMLRIHKMPQAVPCLLEAVDFWLAGPRKVVVAGPPGRPDTCLLLHQIHRAGQPNKVVLGTEGPVEPSAKKMGMVNGEPVAHICTSRACHPPTRDPAELKRLLGQ